ncbi:bactofilin family protein [Acidisoma cladoniae]|uniref:bactofilin family protein n=1 Tax=Acidisoma cladoniae TaxID=3040935 RepID=UPI00254B8286|nr:polymer-forming cytoskeletal protein [Acidisoma sp. PAMC 29798]
MIRRPLRQGRDETIVFKRRSSRPEDDVQEPAQKAALPGFLSAGRDAQTGVAKPTDNGLGVPPFRPAPTKDKDSSMARPPFAPNPTSTPVLPPVPPRPGMPNQSRPAAEPAERRTLVVGRGISVQGTISDAERLVVEGTVEASMIHAAELFVAEGGVFKGEIQVEEAEIAGTIDGVVTARTSLMVRASGRVLGRARCRRLSVEDGGQLTGQIEMLSDAPAPSASAPPPISTQGSASSFSSDISRPEVPRSDFSLGTSD